MRKLRIRLLWVGKTREAYLKKGIDDYLDRLGPYAEVEVVEIREEKGASGAISADGLAREGKRITEKSGGYVLLDERGRQMSSPELAAYLGKRSAVDFVLGGAYGVSDEVRARASDTISLSSMTLTHEMARLLFAEQLYRACTIIRGMRYHH